MSRLAYYADFATIPALILVLILRSGAGPLALAAGLMAGVLAWSLAEYLIHRYLFHRLPLFRVAHDEHHARPCTRTGVTSWHSLAVFGLLAALVPHSLLAGFALGYLAYIVAHHAVHHWRIAPRHPLYALKLRHAAHHRGVEANFGVVTTLWDRVFGTYRPRP